MVNMRSTVYGALGWSSGSLKDQRLFPKTVTAREILRYFRHMSQIINMNNLKCNATIVEERLEVSYSDASDTRHKL